MHILFGTTKGKFKLFYSNKNCIYDLVLPVDASRDMGMALLMLTSKDIARFRRHEI